METISLVLASYGSHDWLNRASKQSVWRLIHSYRRWWELRLRYSSP